MMLNSSTQIDILNNVANYRLYNRTVPDTDF